MAASKRDSPTTQTALKASPIWSLVAFIDILGFSERTRRIRNPRSLESLANDVRFVQSEFGRAPKDPTTRKEVLAFSDCIVTSLPSRSPYTKIAGTFDAFMSEIIGIAWAQGNCALRGIFLRGGIDFGYWYHKGDLLISKALANAYVVEREAVVPVIGLSRRLHQFLSKHHGKHAYAPSADPMTDVFAKCNLGQTSFQFVDYVGICADSVDWVTGETRRTAYKKAKPDEKSRILTEGYLVNQKRWFRRHRDAVLKARKLATEKKVIEKYEWLASHHNRVAQSLGYRDCLI